MSELNVNDLNNVAGGAFDFSTIPATHTVKTGENLSLIVKNYGLSKCGYTWTYLYNLNEDTIIAEAKKHGVTANFENYIYPGQILKLK